MKKIISMLLILSMIISLTACGTKTDDVLGVMDQLTSTEPQQTIPTETTPDGEIIMPTVVEINTQTQWVYWDGLNKENKLSRQELCNSEKYQFSVNNIDYTDKECYIEFEFFNSSGNMADCFVAQLGINGWMIPEIADGYINSICNGAGDLFEVAIHNDWLKMLGISEINEVAVVFSVNGELTDVFVFNTENPAFTKTAIKSEQICEISDLKISLPTNGAITVHGGLYYIIENNGDKTQSAQVRCYKPGFEENEPYDCRNGTVFPGYSAVASLEFDYIQITDEKTWAMYVVLGSVNADGEFTADDTTKSEVYELICIAE